MTKPPALRVVAGDPGPQEGFGQAPPHNIAAEQVVLGAVMLSPRALDDARALLDGTEFYRPAHQRIWEAVTALADRGNPCDPLAVGAELGRDIDRAGGAPYLHTLITSVPVTASAGYYAHLIRDLAYARKVIETGSRLAQLGHDAAATGDPGSLRAHVTAQVADVIATDRRGWPDPTPLQASRNVPEFPIWTLPDWLGEYAAALAEQSQTPVDMAGCLALSVLAVAAGGKVWVHTGRWTEPLCLYTLTVLGPGNRKSEVYSSMTAPILAAEKALQEQARPAIAEAVIARRIAEAHAEKTAKTAEAAASADLPDTVKQATALAEAADAAVALDGATIPPVPRLFSDEPTVEKLTSLLAEQGGRFALLSPEGEIFSIASGKYSGAPNFGILKAGHAGEQVRIDRMGRASEQIDAACLTLGVCTQPGVLARLGETPQFREQGLLGRLLYSVPESLLGRRNPWPDPIPAATQAAYHSNLSALVLSLNTLGGDTDLIFTLDDDGKAGPVTHERPHRHTLTFTTAGQDAIRDLLKDIEPRFLPGADLHHMSDWGGKLVGAIVRIAGLLHLAQHFRDGWNRPIDAATLANAAQLGQYFTAHAQAAYDAIGADPAVSDARAILEWIRNTRTPRFKASELLPSNKHRFKKVTDLDAGLRVLETHGWIRRLPTPPITGRGRPTAPTYDAHPDTLQDIHQHSQQDPT